MGCDLRSLPFPDNYADEAHAIHVIEHFNRMEVEKVLWEWKRVLKPGGKLVLECPCLDKIAEWLPKSRDEVWLRMTLIGLYGEYWHGDDAMLHKWCYSKAELTNILARCGYVSGVVMEPKFHMVERDMRVVARK